VPPPDKSCFSSRVGALETPPRRPAHKPTSRLPTRRSRPAETPARGSSSGIHAPFVCEIDRPTVQGGLPLIGTVVSLCRTSLGCRPLRARWCRPRPKGVHRINNTSRFDLEPAHVRSARPRVAFTPTGRGISGSTIGKPPAGSLRDLMLRRSASGMGTRPINARQHNRRQAQPARHRHSRRQRASR